MTTGIAVVPAVASVAAECDRTIKDRLFKDSLNLNKGLLRRSFLRAFSNSVIVISEYSDDFQTLLSQMDFLLQNGADGVGKCSRFPFRFALEILNLFSALGFRRRTRWAGSAGSSSVVAFRRGAGTEGIASGNRR